MIWTMLTISWRVILGNQICAPNPIFRIKFGNEQQITQIYYNNLLLSKKCLLWFLIMVLDLLCWYTKQIFLFVSQFAQCCSFAPLFHSMVWYCLFGRNGISVTKSISSSCYIRKNLPSKRYNYKNVHTMQLHISLFMPL